MSRIKSKPELRIGIFQMGGMIVEKMDGSGEISGLAGNYLKEYNSYLADDFNLTYVWTRDRGLAGVKINNTYSGVLKQFVMNLSDCSTTTLPLSPEADVAELGEIQGTFEAKMVSLMKINEYPDMILDQLFHFSAEVVFMMMLTTYVFARLLSKTEGSADVGKSMRSLFEGIWTMIEMLVNQSQVSPITNAGRILVLMTSIGVLFWTQIWMNQMKTEMIAYDTSQVISTLDDALRLNKTAVMTNTDPVIPAISHAVKSDPMSPLGQLVKRGIFLDGLVTKPGASTSGVKMDSGFISKFVLFLSKEVLIQMNEVICMRFPSDCNFLVGSEVLAEIISGPWNNVLLNPVYKRILSKKFTQIREADLTTFFIDSVNKFTKQYARQFIKDVPDCVYHSLEAKIDELSSGRIKSAIAMDQFYDVFRLLFFATLGSGVVLILERTGMIEAAAAKYHNITKNVKRNRVNPKSADDTKTNNRQMWANRRTHFLQHPYLRNHYNNTTLATSVAKD